MSLCHRVPVGSSHCSRSAAAFKTCRTRTLYSRPRKQQRMGFVSTHSTSCEAAGSVDLVDDVLKRIQNTDRGASISSSERAKIDSLLGQLEDIGKQQQPQPLDNDLLFNHFSVEYVSKGPQQTGEPAGGRFRRGVGKFLFTTQGLYQSVMRPDIATNKVEFKLLGVIPGYVGLRGRVEPVDKATVKVFFEPAVLSLANWFTVRLGSTSWVQLTTTYLDERVRLGRGSFGSLFVFQRGEQADNAGMDQVGIEPNLVKIPGPALIAGYLAVLGACAAAFFTWQPVLQGLAALTALLATGITSVLYRGGNDDDDEQREAKAKQEQAFVAASKSAKGNGAAAAAAGTAAVSVSAGSDGVVGASNGNGGAESEQSGSVAKPVSTPVAAA